MVIFHQDPGSQEKGKGSDNKGSDDKGNPGDQGNKDSKQLTRCFGFINILFSLLRLVVGLKTSTGQPG